MTDVRPFRGLRYDPPQVDLSRVIVPPYDVITPEERVGFHARDPHSAIRSSCPATWATRPATTTWRRRWPPGSAKACCGAMRRRPSTRCARRFAAPDGRKLVREGFFGLLHLEDYERRIVRPHERTLAGPKADRLRLLRAARANLSVVFLLYEDRENELRDAVASGFSGGPLGVAHDGAGIEHALGCIDGARRAARRAALPGGAPGGDRRRPPPLRDGAGVPRRAARRRAERRPRRSLRVHARLLRQCLRRGHAPAPDPPRGAQGSGAERGRLASGSAGLAGAPRGAAGRRRSFRRCWPSTWRRSGAGRASPPTTAPARFASSRARGRRRRAGDPRRSTGTWWKACSVSTRRRCARVRWPSRRMRVRAAEDVRAGRGAVALYLNPLSPEDVFRVTGAGEILPQKSTFFLPKLPTGLVFRSLRGLRREAVRSRPPPHQPAGAGRAGADAARRPRSRGHAEADAHPRPAGRRSSAPRRRGTCSRACCAATCWRRRSTPACGPRRCGCAARRSWRRWPRSWGPKRRPSSRLRVGGGVSRPAQGPHGGGLSGCAVESGRCPAQDQGADRSPRAGLVCDFCGERSPTVRRIALDRGYDRLQPSSRELYACPPCSDAKEKSPDRASPR